MGTPIEMSWVKEDFSFAFFPYQHKIDGGICLAVQWLRLQASTARAHIQLLVREPNVLYTTWCSQNINFKKVDSDHANYGKAEKNNTFALKKEITETR